MKKITALGNFDGVHIGHAALLKTCVNEAERLGARPMIWTFERHRLSPPYITDKPAKLGLFRRFGIDDVCFEVFEDFRDLSPEEFVRDVLVGTHNCTAAVCGFNFRFGKGGLGTAETLTELCRAYGIECIVCGAVEYEGRPVSSTRIRKALTDGDIKAVNAMLGRRYVIDRPIVEGKQVGRRMDMPTMNQHFGEGEVIPKHGVYAASVTIDGGRYAAVTNIGIRPTFDDGSGITCETHVIGYSGDLYGRCVPVELCEYLREEKRFDDASELVAQIRLDIDRACSLLK